MIQENKPSFNIVGLTNNCAAYTNNEGLEGGGGGGGLEFSNQ